MQQRYFFDVATHSYVQYDYKGQVFDVWEKVRRQAELIALDIECLNNNDELADQEVQVRDITGRQLFSVLIRKLELIAA